MSRSLSRRDFLKAASVGLSSLAFRSWPGNLVLPEFPEAGRLGRVIGGKVPVKARPDIDSEDVGVLWDDDVVPWLSDMIGSRPMWHSQRFVEIPDGYVYAPNLHPVRNLPNSPLSELPHPEGIWVEVTIPYVDLVLDNPPARSPWLKNTQSPRLYYSQILWVDAIRQDETGETWYRVKEKYGTFGDIFWAWAGAFRPLTEADVSPIHPEAEDKRVVVDVTDQTMACYEGTREVYFCRISTGGKYDAEGNPSDKWSTPVGPHSIWRKLVSVHMTGGTTGGGYDLPGIGWTVLFSGNGVAIHSTFWHNSFGIPQSHGCVNARPEDAQWVFRWTLPDVPYLAGDITISGPQSTKVVVIER